MGKGFYFDEDNHKYFFDDIEVPGVSHILKTLDLVTDFAGVDPFYRDRGTAVHKAIELFLDDKLDETTIDPVCVPFFDGFKLWFKDHGHKRKVQASEKSMYSVEDNFAGTLDLVHDNVIWDFKCTKTAKREWELQGFAYQRLWASETGILLPFKALQLPGDGSYKIVEYGSVPNIWGSILDIYQWKIKGKKNGTV